MNVGVNAQVGQVPMSVYQVVVRRVDDADHSAGWEAEVTGRSPGAPVGPVGVKVYAAGVSELGPLVGAAIAEAADSDLFRAEVTVETLW